MVDYRTPRAMGLPPHEATTGPARLRRRLSWPAAVLAVGILAGSASAITSSGSQASDGSWPTVFADVDINALVGAKTLYDQGYYGSRAVIANVEAGFIWNQHDVFLWSQNGSFNSRSTPITQIKDATAAGGYDYHATMVGHVLAGDSPWITLRINFPGGYYTFPYKPEYGDQFTFTSGGKTLPLNATLWYGIAPEARLASVAIATDWVRDNAVEWGGEFNVSAQTVYTAYQTAMAGTSIAGNKANVINSSWGGEDPTGTDSTTRLIDALAYANRTTVSLAAGNDTTQVVGPASGYNSITVGALGYGTGSSHYQTVADFSATGPNDYYNPKTHTTILGVRAAVDLVAPGENLTLACYGGLTGGHNADIGTDPTLGSGGYYFITASGTSFASPIVAGGAALLIDAGKVKFAGDYAIDGRVIKAVLMNAAGKTPGWNNGQHLVSNTIFTDQGLDYAAGAGRLDLTQALRQYTAGSPDAAAGDGLNKIGWSYGIVQPSGSNDYLIARLINAGTPFTATLDWFVDRAVDGTTADEVQFANLDLEIWKLTGLHGTPVALVAESASIYNNVEHLSFNTPADGYYMLRVKWTGENYDLNSPAAEPYALAWAAPEPGTLCLLLAGSVLAILRRRREASPSSKVRKLPVRGQLRAPAVRGGARWRRGRPRRFFFFCLTECIWYRIHKQCPKPSDFPTIRRFSMNWPRSGPWPRGP